MKALQNQKITPFLWFDNQAEEAIRFYTTVFPNARINLIKKWPEHGPFPADTVQSGSFVLDGFQFHAFDAGPQFRFSPSISFFVVYETSEEIDALWDKLIEGGEAMMPIDSYAWSDRYGWLRDKFGISWQLMKGQLAEVGQSISPLFFFSGSRRGRAEEAMNFYMSVFKNSASGLIDRYEPGEIDEKGGMVKYARCQLNGQTHLFMDSGVDNNFPFTEAISLFVSCDDQKEVDYYWKKFLEDGGIEQQCGWLKDKFGVSWQIVPQFLIDKVESGEPARVQNMMMAMNKMVKMDVAELKEAYDAKI